MPKQSETFRLRLAPELQQEARRLAESEQRTLASLLRFLLVRYLEEKAKEAAHDCGRIA